MEPPFLMGLNGVEDVCGLLPTGCCGGILLRGGGVSLWNGCDGRDCDIPVVDAGCVGYTPSSSSPSVVSISTS